MVFRYFLVFIFLLVVCIACTNDPPISLGYRVSGKVNDSLGKGIGHIRIYYLNNTFVSTDSLGLWQTGLLEDSTSIHPTDTAYTFTPTTFRVTETTHEVVFVAHSKKIQPMFAEKIYRWFVDMQLPNGLLESSENSNFVSLYDNALAALVFLAHGDIAKAEAVFDFFNNRIDAELLAGYGGFIQFRDRSGVPSGKRWLGDNAWLLIALNNYSEITASNKYQTLREALTQWIRSLHDTDDSLWGGYDADGMRIGKITEGMIDAFDAVSGYDSFHKGILAYLHANRWNPTEKLLISWPGNRYAYALDNHSWGYCSLEDFPLQVLQKADMHKATHASTATGKDVTGYCFDIDRDDVWLEGTGQMVVAFNKAGEASLADFYLEQLTHAMVASTLYPETMGLPYTTNRGSGYATELLWVGTDTKPCISSGAWYLFGVGHFDPMFLGSVKNIPASEKFWKE